MNLNIQQDQNHNKKELHGKSKETYQDVFVVGLRAIYFSFHSTRLYFTNVL